MAIYIEEIEGIPTFRMIDTYGPSEIDAVVRTLGAIEAGTGPIPDRIMDLSAVETFETDFGNLSAVAEERRKKVYRNCYRSAFVASKPVQLGFARMYQTLAQNPSVEFVIVPSLEAALAWLKSPPSEKKDPVITPGLEETMRVWRGTV